MTTSIIPQLVRKDLLLWRRMILIFCGVSLACITMVSILVGRIPDLVLMNVGFTLLITPVGALGIVLLIQTNVFEKVKSTQSFIMSLPVTVREFTLAKLLVNLPVFGALWLVTTGTAFYFAYGLDLLPLGTLPFMTMIFLGIFVAYICILSVSMLSQSLGVTIAAIMFFEIGTSAYLWVIVFLDPIRSHIYGPEIVWNSAATTIVTIQVLVVIAVLTATFFTQNRKRDFI